MKTKVVYLIKIAGVILTFLSFFYIVKKIWTIKDDLKPVSAALYMHIGKLLVCILLIAITIIINGIVWRGYLSCFSMGKVYLRQSLKIYLKSNIAKYLPGNFGHYVGRNVLGKQLGVSQLNLGISSVLEFVFISFSAVIFSLSFSHEVVFYIVNRLLNQRLINAIVILFIMLSVIILLVVKNDFLRIYINKSCIKVYLKSIAMYFLSNYISAYALFIIISQVFELNVPYGIVATGSIISWVAGYMVLGSPGGIGIRETVLILILNAYIPQNYIVMAALVQRCCCIAADLLLFIFSQVVYIEKKDYEK